MEKAQTTELEQVLASLIETEQQIVNRNREIISRKTQKEAGEIKVSEEKITRYQAAKDQLNKLAK